MRRSLALALTVAALAAPAAHASPAAASTAAARTSVSSPATTTLGKRLVTRYWRLLKAADKTGLKAFLSPAFQNQRADGTGATKAEYIPGVGTKVVIKSFALSDFVVTRTDDILVARFFASSDQVINGQAYSKSKEPRIATFHLENGAWQMTSNANFNSPAPTS